MLLMCLHEYQIQIIFLFLFIRVNDPDCTLLNIKELLNTCKPKIELAVPVFYTFFP